MELKNLTGERQVCWDWELVEKAENISLETMKPVRKNVAIAGENPWEKFYSATA